MTVRSAHRQLVDAIARRTGLTGEPWHNRPLHLSNHGSRPGAPARHALPARHDPARRRVLVRWQGRVESWLRGARS